MAKGPWTNDEIRAADDRLQQRCETTFPIITINELIAELTAPTLWPTQPVMYTHDGRYNLLDFAERLEGCNNATNVRALFTEDKVRQIAFDLFEAICCGDLAQDQARMEFQAQLDAIKYGRGSDET